MFTCLAFKALLKVGFPSSLIKGDSNESERINTGLFLFSTISISSLSVDEDFVLIFSIYIKRGGNKKKKKTIQVPYIIDFNFFDYHV